MSSYCHDFNFLKFNPVHNKLGKLLGTNGFKQVRWGIFVDLWAESVDVVQYENGLRTVIYCAGVVNIQVFFKGANGIHRRKVAREFCAVDYLDKVLTLG